MLHVVTILKLTELLEIILNYLAILFPIILLSPYKPNLMKLLRYEHGGHERARYHAITFG